MRRFMAILMTCAVVSPADAQEEFLFGEFQREIGELSDPMSVAIGDDGTIYVVQESACRVIEFDSKGTLLKQWGTFGDGNGEFISPRGIALPDDESIVVSDGGTHRLQLFNREGRLQLTWGGLGTSNGKFNEPTGIAVHGDKVYVVDSGNHRLQVFDRQGKFVHAFGKRGTRDSEFNRPIDVAIDDAGNVYVADAHNNRIQKFDSSGKFLKAWGEWGPFPGMFDEPTAVTCFGNYIYVADRRNHRLQVFTTDGELVEDWGIHEVIPHEGGGRLHYPNDIVIAPSGEFAVVCESFENRCQVFAARKPGEQPPVRKMYDRLNQTHFGEHVDIDGRLMVIAEPENHFIFVFDLGYEVPIIINQFGERGTTPGFLFRPDGLSIDFANRNILVSDPYVSRLQQYSFDYEPGGGFRFVPDMTRFARAWDVSVFEEAMGESKPPWPIEATVIERSGDGRLYIGDARNSQIYMFDRDLSFVRAFCGWGSGPGEFCGIANLVLSHDEELLYVVDSLNRRIQALNANGEFQFEWGNDRDDRVRFLRPFGIEAGRDGFVYVTDSASDFIYKCNRYGKFVAKWSKQGTGMGELWKPKGLAQDPEGRIIVVDYGNHRGQIFSPDGEWLVTFTSGSVKTREMVPKSN